METFPLTVMAEAAVKLTAVPTPILLVRFPRIANAVAGKVFVAEAVELLNVRFP